jgi:threonine dehydrogenase-like Zn-dependent dehydrogenase
VPGGQAQYLRVPQAQFGPVKVPAGTPDEQYLYLSDILPTAYQAVAYADVPDGGTLAVLGLGPVGQMAARIARHLGVERVIGVDPCPNGGRQPRGSARRPSTRARSTTPRPR